MVGSSSSSTLGLARSVSTSCSRRRSPPDSRPIGAHWASASNQKRSRNRASSQSGWPPSARRRRARPAASGRARGRAGRSSRRRRSLPITTWPSTGARRPASTSSSVDLPAPLGPDDPEALAGVERQVDAPEQPPIRRRSGGRRPASSTTVSPSRGAPKARSSSPRRAGASGPPSTSAVAASMRAWGLRVRAGAPRRSQASSERARLRRTSSAGPPAPRARPGPRGSRRSRRRGRSRGPGRARGSGWSPGRARGGRG